MDIEEKVNFENINSIIEAAQKNEIDLSETITNNEFKEALYSEFQKNGISYNIMRTLVNKIGEEKCIQNLDIDKIMLASNNTSDRYFTTLLENGNSSLIDKVINDEKYMEYFFKELDKNYSVISYCDNKKTMELLEKVNSLEKEIPNSENLAIGLCDEDKKKILNGEYKDKFVNAVINNSDNELVQDYINNSPKALYKYKEIGVVKLAQRGISFPSDIVKQKDFFEQLKDVDLVNFRRNINIVNRNSYHPILDKKMKEYEEEILEKFDPNTGMFKDYDLDDTKKLEELLEKGTDYVIDWNAKKELSSYLRAKKYLDSRKSFFNEGIKEKLNLNINVDELENMDINDITDDEKVKDILVKIKEEISNQKDVFNQETSNIKSNLKEISNSKFGEVMIDSAFEDTKKNVKINIREMLRFNGHLEENEKILDQDKEKFYSMIFNIDALSSEQKYEIYKNIKNRNMTAEFYSDFSKLKNKSYENINKALYKINENSELAVQEAMENQTEIYKLKGDPFCMLVRALNSPIREKTNNPHSCYSLISGTNTKTFDEGFAEYLYGYDKLEPKMIENVFESDSYTLSSDKNITTRPNRIMTPEEITESSETYSEINIKNEEIVDENGKKKYKEMKPSYLVTMKSPTKEQIEESKRLGIPIVYVERERYQSKKIDDVEYEEYDYDIN